MSAKHTVVVSRHCSGDRNPSDDLLQRPSTSWNSLSAFKVSTWCGYSAISRALIATRHPPTLLQAAAVGCTAVHLPLEAAGACSAIGVKLAFTPVQRRLTSRARGPAGRPRSEFRWVLKASAGQQRDAPRWCPCGWAGSSKGRRSLGAGSLGVRVGRSTRQRRPTIRTREKVRRE